MKKIMFLALTACSFHPSLVHAQCAPVTAKICVAGDDSTQVWVNGVYQGKKDYCDQKGGCDASKLCMPVAMDLLKGTEACLGIETANINPVMVYSSWELEVTCPGGTTFTVNSENPAQSGVSLYWDPTGGSSCGMGASPPVDASGKSWTELGYNPASNPFTFTGTVVTAQTWTAAQLLNAHTHVIIPFISYSAQALGSGPAQGCGILYWRQVAKLPQWLPTATSTASFTPIPILKPTVTPTFTPSHFFTFTPSFTPTATPRPRRRATPTPIPTSRPKLATPVPAHRIQLKPTPTFVTRRPTRIPTPFPMATWTPVPQVRKRPTPVPTWLPRLDRAQTIVFQTPPVEVYATFADGPGRYQLEVVDGQGTPLKAIFDKRVVAESEDWVMWDGKNGQGRDVPVGQYFVIFYKDGKPLRSISVFRSGMGR